MICKKEKPIMSDSHIKMLLNQIKIDSKLEKMSDKEIAKLLFDHIGAHIHMFSFEYAIIEQAIERLGGLDD